MTEQAKHFHKTQKAVISLKRPVGPKIQVDQETPHHKESTMSYNDEQTLSTGFMNARFYSIKQQPPTQADTVKLRNLARRVHTSQNVGQQVYQTSKSTEMGGMDLLSHLQSPQASTIGPINFQSMEMQQQYPQTTKSFSNAGISRIKNIAQDLMHMKMSAQAAGQDTVNTLQVRSNSKMTDNGSTFKSAQRLVGQSKRHLATANISKRLQLQRKAVKNTFRASTQQIVSSRGQTASSSANYNGHYLARHYELQGTAPLYKRKARGDHRNRISDFVDSSDAFIYGGWTRTKDKRKDVSAIETTMSFSDSNKPLDNGVSISKLIPDLSSKLFLRPADRRYKNLTIEETSSSGLVNMSADFSRFTTKGQPQQLALQPNTYTSSFGQTMSRDRDQAKLFMVNSRGLLSPQTLTSSGPRKSEMRGEKKQDAGLKLVLSPGRQNQLAKTIDNMSMSIRASSQQQGKRRRLMSPQGNDCNADDVVIEATPDEFQEEYKSLKYALEQQHKKRLVNPVNDVDQSDENDFDNNNMAQTKYTTFDFKSFKDNLERRWDDQNNDMLQLDQLKEQMNQQLQDRMNEQKQATYKKMVVAASSTLVSAQSQANDLSKSKDSINKVKLLGSSFRAQKTLIKQDSFEKKKKRQLSQNVKRSTQKLVKVVEPIENQTNMLSRLRRQSIILDRNTRQSKFFSKVKPYFDNTIYEHAKIKIDQMESDEDKREGNRNDKQSVSSFKSGKLYSSHVPSVCSEEQDKVDDLREKDEDGDQTKSEQDESESYFQSQTEEPQLPSQKGGKKLDKFMHNIEKKIAKGSGLRGFRRMKSEASAFDERSRSHVLTKLLHSQMSLEDKEEAKQIAQKQTQMQAVEENEEDTDSWGSKGQLPADLKHNTPNKLLKAGSMQTKEIIGKDLLILKIKDQFSDGKQDAGPEVQKLQKQFTIHKIEQSLPESDRFSSDESTARENAFFEELKAERAQFVEQNIYSDDSDLDKQILGIEDEEEQKEENRTQAQKMFDDRIEKEKELNPKEAERRLSMLSNLQSIIAKVKFKEVMQKLESGAQSGLDQTNAFVFQKECLNSMDLMLPVMDKIKNNALVLQDYGLSAGQIGGVAKAITMIGEPMIKQILVDNCRMTDTMLAELLGVFLIRRTLVELAYKRNVFMLKSLEALTPLLQIQPPQNLYELRLVNCQTTPKIMEQLLSALARSQNTNQLRCLAIVQMRVNFPLDDLAKLIESPALHELDFSGNDCLPRHFVPLWKNLAFNKTLHSLNLSWNMLIDNTCSGSNEEDEQSDAKLRAKYSAPLTQILSQGLTNKFIYKEFLSSVQPGDIPQLLLESISQLIRYNQNIQSIILDNTGLNSYVIYGFVPALRHAKSLLCFHLAQNPGINKDVKAFWHERLSIAPKEAQIAIDVKRDRDDLKRPLTAMEQKEMSENDLKIRDYKVANFRKWLAEEAAEIQQQRQWTKIFKKQEVNIMSAYNSDLSISRILGHSVNMQGSGQWRLNKKLDRSSCWYCGNWIQTLIFWNQDIGIYNANNNINIESNEKRRVMDSIRQHDPDYMSNEDVPMLFSNATNWKGKPFIRLLDFVMQNTTVPDFNYQASEMAKELLEYMDWNELNEEKKEAAEIFISEREAELRRVFEADLMKSYGSQDCNSKRNLRYGKTLYINHEKVVNPGNTFVLPIFIKPGRTHFMLRTPIDHKIKKKVDAGGRVRILNYQLRSDVHFKFYYNRHIVPHRDEKVPGFAKRLKIDLDLTAFSQENSVFKEWQKDNHEIIANCLYHDFERWKVKRFVKDARDLGQVKNFLKDNFSKLKEIRMGIIADSGDPPQMNHNQFFKFCRMAKMHDKAVTQGMLESSFAATNFDHKTQSWNKETSLLRYEFFEVLVRIARAKYVDNGILADDESYRALHRLVNEHILPILQNKKLPEWQPFRDKYLWKKEVHDLFYENQGCIRGLYKQILGLKGPHIKQRYCITNANSATMISIDQVLYFFDFYQIGRKKNRSSKEKYLFNSVYLTDRMIRTAFYLCKMTVADESLHGPLEFNHLLEVEFLEFIGRLAYLFFESTTQHEEWTLELKIEKLLGWMFKPCHFKVAQPQENDAFISDSDDDY